MARTPIENRGWIVEEHDSTVITLIKENSAAESVFRRVSMGTDAKTIPRGSTVGVGVVAKGTAYPEDVHEYDDVTLNAVKVGIIVRLAEEDLDDSSIGIIATKQAEWATSYARYIDNATLAVTAAKGAGVPYTSLYRVLSTADADTGYLANANIVKTAGELTYAGLSDTLAIRESSRYFDPSKEVVIASPAFKSSLRMLKDDSGRFIFAASPALGQPDTVLGYPVVWSGGARTSAIATDEPTGNPIMVFANRDLLILGVRSGPESVVIDGRDGTSAETDETLLKMRARRAFVVGHPNGAAILEVTAGA